MFESRKYGSGLAVIKDEPGLGRAGGDIANSLTEGFEGEIRNDSQPGEKGRSAGIEA